MIVTGSLIFLKGETTMAKYQKGQQVLISDEVEGTRLGGFPVEIWTVDEAKNLYIVMLRDPVVLGGENTGVFFWVPEENLKDMPEPNASDAE